MPKNLLEIQWEREEKKKETEDRPPEADFRGIYSDPVLKARMITELEAIYADSSNDLDPKDLVAMMNLWNETGAKILPRQQRKPSPAWFDLSAEILLPAIEEKRKLTKDFYRKGGDKTKEKLVEMRRKVAGLVDAAKIRWLEKKVKEMENKFDPRGAWKAMREISNMYAGHVKSSVTVRMRKEDGTMAGRKLKMAKFSRSTLMECSTPQQQLKTVSRRSSSSRKK